MSHIVAEKDMIRNKKLLVLGGSDGQMPLIKRAKSLGLKIVLCDFRDNVPGIAVADAFYRVNTMDVDAIVEVGKKEQVDGVIANSDAVFPSWAEIAKKLGVRGLSPEMTALYKNKYLMRQFCAKAGVPYPRYRLCKTIDDAKIFYQEVGKKCIIKPLDNNASRGVFSINSEADLDLHFADSLSASTPENAYVLMEEYITGTEFTIDAIKTAAGNRCLAISEKKHYSYNENVAYQLLFSNENANFDYSQLRETNDRLVDATQLPFGLTHAEYKYQNGKFYLIEIQSRGGGNFISTDIVPFISQIDGYTEFIKWLVGEDVSVEYDYADLSSRSSVLHFFDAPGKGGVVKNVLGLEYLNSLSDKLTYHLNFEIGDTIGEAMDDAHRIGYYILKADSYEELIALMKKIEESFIIEYN